MIHVQRIGRAQRDGAQRLVHPMRSDSPSTRPEDVVRVAAHQAVNSGPSGVIGASEWMA